jgi:hypothetical protein
MCFSVLTKVGKSAAAAEGKKKVFDEVRIPQVRRALYIHCPVPGISLPGT